VPDCASPSPPPSCSVDAFHTRELSRGPWELPDRENERIRIPDDPTKIGTSCAGVAGIARVACETAMLSAVGVSFSLGNIFHQHSCNRDGQTALPSSKSGCCWWR